MSTIAVIVAAGESRRFLENSSHHLKKQYVKYQGVPLWEMAIHPFQDATCVDSIILVVPKDDVLKIQEQCTQERFKKVQSVIAGGHRRQDSVQSAMDWIQNHKIPCDTIFIHDGVRPFISSEVIQRIWERRDLNAVIPVLPVRETIKRISHDQVEETLDRDPLVTVQTPQLFSYGLLRRAYENLKKTGKTVTDDASAVELLGEPVSIVLGDIKNIKVTFPEDLERSMFNYSIGGIINSEDHCTARIGQGMDIHAFTAGNKIILGGIQIPYSNGLKGHSDADVLTHAICDALLGAAGLEDIGTHFPDTDPQYKGISSLVLLEKVVDKVGGSGYKIRNIDSTIIAEEPRLMPYISEMKQCLAKVCKVSMSQIGIKAKTAEGLGFVGRKEGIMAMAVVGLREKNGD